MAFQNENLSMIAYANGFTLWYYTAHEMLATITASGYFNNVKTLMHTGDIVIINSSDNTAIRKVAVSDDTVTTDALS